MAKISARVTEDVGVLRVVTFRDKHCLQAMLMIIHPLTGLSDSFACLPCEFQLSCGEMSGGILRWGFKSDVS